MVRQFVLATAALLVLAASGCALAPQEMVFIDPSYSFTEDPVAMEEIALEGGAIEPETATAWVPPFDPLE